MLHEGSTLVDPKLPRLRSQRCRAFLVQGPCLLTIWFDSGLWRLRRQDGPRLPDTPENQAQEGGNHNSDELHVLMDGREALVLSSPSEWHGSFVVTLCPPLVSGLARAVGPPETLPLLVLRPSTFLESLRHRATRIAIDHRVVVLSSGRPVAMWTENRSNPLHDRRGDPLDAIDRGQTKRGEGRRPILREICRDRSEKEREADRARAVPAPPKSKTLPRLLVTAYAGLTASIGATWACQPTGR